MNIVIALIFSTLTTINATDYFFTSLSSLQSALSKSKSGDRFILADGNYFGATLTIPSNSNGITVMPRTLGGVIFNGVTSIIIQANNVVFQGFQFFGGSSTTKDTISVSGSKNVLTHLNFKLFTGAHFINFLPSSQYNVVSYCNIENKAGNVAGSMIQVGLDGILPGYHIIQYCSFQNMLSGAGGDNGNEPIRLGEGSMSTFSSRTIVEFCVFDNTDSADSESISVKSNDNVIRYNTFSNQQGAKLVFRNGDNNVAYGNFFINAGGIRVKQASNIMMYNNYFYNTGTNNYDVFTYDDVSTYPNSTSYQNNIIFAFNSIIEPGGTINLGTQSKTKNIWIGNIIQKTTGSIFSNQPKQIVFTSNLYFGSLGISVPTTGLTNSAGKLVSSILNKDGYYTLLGSSLARNFSTRPLPIMYDIPVLNDDPRLSLDIAGCGRSLTGHLNNGCNEYNCHKTAANIYNRPLKPSDVGPTYLKSAAPTAAPLLLKSSLLPTLKPSLIPTLKPATSIPTKKPVTSTPTTMKPSLKPLTSSSTLWPTKKPQIPKNFE